MYHGIGNSLVGFMNVAANVSSKAFLNQIDAARYAVKALNDVSKNKKTVQHWSLKKLVLGEFSSQWQAYKKKTSQQDKSFASNYTGVYLKEGALEEIGGRKRHQEINQRRFVQRRQE